MIREQLRENTVNEGSPSVDNDAKLTRDSSIDVPPECWRSVVGYEGKYEVSNQGAVRTIHGRILGQWLSGQGYALVRLSKPRAMVSVHRLVANAFIANEDSNPCVNHIDCVRNNNFWRNLEWCTQQENLHHSDRLGRMQRDYWVGKRSPNAMLSDAQVLRIREMYSTGCYSWERIAHEFEVSKRCIGRVINRETYSDVQ